MSTKKKKKQGMSEKTGLHQLNTELVFYFYFKRCIKYINVCGAAHTIYCICCDALVSYSIRFSPPLAPRSYIL